MSKRWSEEEEEKVALCVLARRDLLVLPVQAAATLLPLAVAVQSHKRTKEQEDSSQNQNTEPPNRGASLTTVLQPGSI